MGIACGLLTMQFAEAQQTAKQATIGFLGATTPSAAREWLDAFVHRLQELGWVEGQNLAIEYRWVEGRTERAAQVVAELVRLNVNVIVTYGSASVIAAKQVTSVIPIVFAAAGDPLGDRLVTSLARPGGNITGFSLQVTDTAPKRLELLREILPRLRRLAIMAHVDAGAAMNEMSEVQALAGTMGIQTLRIEIRRPEDIAPAVDALNGRAEALYVCTDPLLSSHRSQLSTLALAARLATIYLYRNYVEAGGLLCYGPSFANLFYRAAGYVDKILRGTKPGDLPIEQPTKFELIINLRTAKALGLTIPQSLLTRADEVIQ
jgi:putative ABC transport system substrate-binding protein